MEADITSASRFYFSPVLYMMYNINKGLAVVATAGLFACSAAFGAEYWVDGVNQYSGWYDANKPVDEMKTDYTSMASMCHAATAANLISWWQDKYSNIPTGVATGTDVWASFQDKVNEEKGGTALCKNDVQWWINGKGDVYFNDFNSPYASLSISSESLDKFITYTRVFPASNSVSDVLKNAIISGMGIGLKLSPQQGPHHEITLWGIQTADSGDIIGMWLTDSDDTKAAYGGVTSPSLFYVEVETYTKDENVTLVIKDNELLPDTHKDSDRGLQGYYIHGIYLLDPSISDEWGLVRSVPEPTTATLSLMALAALAARRRRK